MNQPLRIKKKNYGKYSKIFNTFLFLFSNEMLVIKAGIHKMLARIANREDLDQTRSSLIWVCTVFYAFMTGKQCLKFSNILSYTFVLDAQENHLIETVHLSTNNICFC